MKIALIWPNITTLAVDAKYYNVQGYGLARGLSDLGHEVVLMTSYFKSYERGMERSALVTQIRQDDKYEVICMPGYWNARYPLMPHLLGCLARFGPDVIQSAEDISPATLMSIIYSKPKKISLFVYQGIYEHATSFPRLSKMLRKTIFIPVYRFSSGFLAKSNDAAKFLIACGAKTGKTHLVHVGFDDSSFRWVKSDLLNQLTGFSKERRIVVSVGSLIPRKNHAVSIKAIKKLTIKYPDVALAIFGQGPEKNALMSLIHGMGLENFVKIITKRIPNSELHKIYSSSFICLVPSIHEIFGMIVLEAMACRRPVLGSNLGGMKDVIIDGVNGFKVNPHDVNEITSKLKLILDNSNLYKRMCDAAFKRSQQFTWQRIARKFEKHYLNEIRS